jgi:hypothetical protein
MEACYLLMRRRGSMSMHARCRICIGALALVASACSGVGEPYDVEPVDSQGSSVFYSETGANVYYDGGTQCPWEGGGTMHCCAQGYAMIGLNRSTNLFKCARPMTGRLYSHVETHYGDSDRIECNSLYMVIIGYHDDANAVLCADFSPSASRQIVDGYPPQRPTQNGGPNNMHICPPGYAIEAIDENLNAFNCIQ